MRFIHSLTHSPGLWRLLLVRLTSQLSDGAFQAALAFSILFNPDRQTEPMTIALGFAVLLIPYSVIGPFAGALLDHWDRRRVLVWVNVLRAITIALVAFTMGSGAPESAVLVTALLVTGCSRFVASGLSASLPHVAGRDVLMEMNALFTTLGAGVLALGFVISGALRALFGSDDAGSAATLLAGASISLVSAGIAAGFVPRFLGPDTPDDAGHSASYAVAHGLGHGFRAVVNTRTVAVVLSAIGVHRFVFGINMLMILLIVKTLDLGPIRGHDVGAVTVVGAGVALGALFAAFTTPLLIHRIGRRWTIATALILAATAEALLLQLSWISICLSAVLLGLAGQTIKLCGDLAMQADISDTYRGQVFAVQDAVFNIAFVVAMVVAAMVLPVASPNAPVVVLCAVGLYVVAALGVWKSHPKDVRGADPRLHYGDEGAAIPSANPSPSVSSST
ncbi:MAG: MFS transporter [Gordonia sp. (in: high G+C Gram-positive bacteria)]|uniref:MFS transporter n=1 Tax=Gordonia sp. (in: high G+C Gram-positive bacteria) TaxID=84139 RepID=UPI003BB6A80F